jgi:serine/threonine protein kinase
MTQEEFFKRYKYSIRTDKVGGGAFGTVYKAFDEVLNREVAIKVSEVKIMGGKEFSLKDEFDAIKDVPVHPNIANYEELVTIEMPNGIFDYAIMQFYKDGNLSSFIKGDPTLAEKEQVALDLLEGIHHLHKHSVVHRDLKPGNILIVKRGAKIIPVITDFGLSKNAKTEGQSRFSNSFGGGTLKYSSPEQLKAEKLRLNTDLWAYGVIVHEIFTGKNLFMAQNITGASAEAEKEIYEQIIGVDVSEMINELPGKWQEVVKQCLVRDGAKRIKSAEALKELILNGESSPKEKEPFIEDKTIIDSNEPEEFIDDKTVIEEPKQIDKQKANKPISEKPKEFKSKYAYDYKAEEKRKKQTLIGVGITAVAIVIVLLSYLFIPNKSNEVWELAQSVNTINSYESFISQNPESEFVLMAKDHIAWLGALESNSTAAYENYLNTFPSGNYIALAKENALWQTTKNKNTIKSYKAYLTAYQKGMYEKDAEAAITGIEAFQKSEARRKKLAAEQAAAKKKALEEQRQLAEAERKRKEKEEEVIEDVAFSVIEDAPIYPGCEKYISNAERKKCMDDEIGKHINKKRNKEILSILGLVESQKESFRKIWFTFIINKQGNITNIRTRGPHRKLEHDIERVIQSLPKMKPGKQRGKPVGVIYSHHFDFYAQ